MSWKADSSHEDFFILPDDRLAFSSHCGDKYSDFLSHRLKMTPKCAVVAPRVIFVEIDEGVDDTVFRRGLRTLSMLSIARSALLFQHNFWALFANVLLLLVGFSLRVSSR